MSLKKKKTKQGSSKRQKRTSKVTNSYSTEQDNLVWCFDRIDRDGKFAFDINRSDFNHRQILGIIIEYSNMTWADIRGSTHDDGKSKHHYISADDFSHDATKRFNALKLSEEEDALFSLAITNKIRIFGIRNGSKFHPIWYDPRHEVCPIK